MELNFYSLSSGSSGNCYYLGNGQGGILIDAGIPGSSVIRFLKMASIPVASIMGILVTHNHTDHTRGLEYLTRRSFLPAFTTSKVRKSILSPKKRIAPDSIREIPLEKEFHLAGFEITAFPVSHDAPETIGFHIRSGENTITIATDLGYICNKSAEYIKAANLLVIESNYDEQMLIKGRYPWFLKERIQSDRGHLGNHQVSAFLADIIGGKLSHICLAHLSNNNNTPDLALKTLYNTFTEKGIVLNGSPVISVLNRHMPTDMIRITG
ncbi:MAG: MBL fold metallo-hydrolase [Bacteroidales bacterium]|nr:MBL fold metallo-hydrolase [Bacteroidales bacterium]